MPDVHFKEVEQIFFLHLQQGVLIWNVAALYEEVYVEEYSPGRDASSSYKKNSPQQNKKLYVSKKNYLIITKTRTG